MKPLRIWTIVSFMTVALVGLTSFQVYWINNAIELNRDHFRQNVNESLKLVADKIERHEALKYTAKSIFEFKDGEVNQRTIVLDSGNQRNIVVLIDDSIATHNIVEINPNEKLRNRSIKSKEARFEGNHEKIEARVKSKSEVINVVLEEMMFRDKDHLIKDRVSVDLLDSLLHEEFTNKGINISYQYAIWNTKKDSIVMGNNADLNEIRTSDLKAALFPNDILGNVNYLMVNFPKESQYLFRQIWLTLVVSLIFILIIVSCFAYAINIIFRQKKISAIKNDFINNMTHEFKTPIATVSLACQALAEAEVKSDPEKIGRYVGVINEENQRLSEQVQKVLQAALLDKESFTLSLKPFSVHQIIEKVLKNNGALNADNLNVELKANKDTVSGDEHHITNVIHNLIDNAIKYSPDKLSINISSNNRANNFVMSISDSGIGISRDAQRKIFEKFYRVPTGNRHDVKGFGLGLSYVKTIIEKHGGLISVDAELGKGSTFEIQLPLSERKV